MKPQKNESNTMKRWHFFVSIAAVLIFSFIISQDALARLAAYKYGRPDIALALNRNDNKLAYLDFPALF